MIEINLIPSVKKELLKTRSMRNRVISLSSFIGTSLVIGVVVLGVIFGGQLAAEAIQDNTIKDKYKELSSTEDLDKIVTIQNQLTKISSLHDSKKLNSRLFDVVSAVNPAAPNDVTFSMIKLNPEEKTITLEGSAVQGYEALESLKKTILRTKIKIEGESTNEVPLADSIIDGEASFGENNEGKRVLQFSMSFNYPDELFAVARDAKVSIITPTGRVDVTDSKQSIPESLFEQNTEKQEEEQ